MITIATGGRVAPSVTAMSTAMSFRVVWPGRFGEESSQVIDELEPARLFADSLASRKKVVAHVVDAGSNETVYSTSPILKRDGVSFGPLF